MYNKIVLVASFFIYTTFYGAAAPLKPLLKANPLVEPEHQMVRYNVLVQLQKLKRQRRGIDFKDENGRSLVHYAAFAGDAKTLLALKKAGADMHAMDKFGFTPFYYQTGHPWDPKYLIDESSTNKADQLHFDPPLPIPPLKRQQALCPTGNSIPPVIQTVTSSAKKPLYRRSFSA